MELVDNPQLLLKKFFIVKLDNKTNYSINFCYKIKKKYFYFNKTPTIKREEDIKFQKFYIYWHSFDMFSKKFSFKNECVDKFYLQNYILLL